MEKKRIIISLILSVFLIGIVKADVTAQIPSPITVTLGEQANYSITLTNHYDFSVFNFSFSNLSGVTFPEINLLPNATQSYAFSVLKQDSGGLAVNSNSRVSFKYLVNIPQGIKTYYVNITQQGAFQPSDLVIRKGDTVVWTNYDVISRGVIGSVFDFNILPNQSEQYIFNQVGEYPYQDLVLFFGGNIQVINETETVAINNPSYDFNLLFNFNILTNPTNLSVTLNQNSYEINATGKANDYLVIKNIGNSFAQNVHISSDLGWMTFDKNDFNLDQGQSISVNYKIQPLVYQVTDTNKTHSLILKLTGLNLNETDYNISVFIPYNSNFADLSTMEGQLALLTRICSDPNYKNTLFCNNTILQGNNGSNVVQDANFNINMTPSQWLAFLKRQQTQTDTITRQGNDINNLQQLAINQGNLLNISNNLSEQSLIKQNKNEDTSNTWQMMFIISLFFAGGFGLLYAVLNANKKSLLNKSLRDGGITVK